MIYFFFSTLALGKRTVHVGVAISFISWWSYYGSISSLIHRFDGIIASLFPGLCVHCFSRCVLLICWSMIIKWFMLFFTVTPTQTTSYDISQAIITEPLTTKTKPDISITTAPMPTKAEPAVTTPITSATDHSFQRSSCTIASAITSPWICPPLQPAADTSSNLSTRITSVLLDNKSDTCMKPFQFDFLLRLALDIQDIRGSSLVRIKVTGEGLDCVQPSTLVYMDLAANQAAASASNNMKKQECPLEGSNNSLNLVTCTYECRPLVPCDGSVRFGVQVQQLSWLTRSQYLEQLCDIRAFVWI